MGAKGVNVQKVTAEHNVQIKFPDRDSGNKDQGMVNGSSSPVEVNGDEPGSPPASPRKCDTIIIIGSKDSAEAAKQALLVCLCETLKVFYLCICIIFMVYALACEDFFFLTYICPIQSFGSLFLLNSLA